MQIFMYDGRGLILLKSMNNECLIFENFIDIVLKCSENLSLLSIVYMDIEIYDIVYR